MTREREALHGVAWAFVAKSSGRLISTAVLVVLARLLDPADFGLVALAAVFVGLLTLVRDQGFAHALVQKRELASSDLSTAFWTSVGLGMALTVAMVIAAAPLSRAVGVPDLAPVLAWLSLTFLLGALRTVPGALLTRRMDFRALALRNALGTAVGGAAGVTAALAGAGVYALVVQALVDVLTELLVVVLKARWRPSLQWSLTSFRALTGFSLRVLGGQVLNYAGRRSDDLLVGVFLGPVALGLYSVAYRLLRLVLEFSIETINMVVLPTLARLQDEDARLRRAFDRAIEATATVCVPAFALLAVLAPDIIRIMFGDRWADAAPLMAVLAVGGLAQPVFMLHVQALIAAGHVTWSLRLSVVNGVSSVLAFAVAVQFGLLAVAAAYSLRAFLVLPVSLLVTRHVLGLSVAHALRSHLAPLVAAGALVAVAHAVRTALPEQTGLRGLATLLLMTSLGAATYVGLLRLLARDQASRTLGLLTTLRRPSRRNAVHVAGATGP